MKRYILFLLLMSSYCLSSFNKFVLLIATYNNESNVEFNLTQALHQDYSDYRIIILNDNSQDRTLQKINEFLTQHPSNIPVIIIDNKIRKGALSNHYYAIHELIADDEIVVILDGDDGLADINVLSYLNEIYTNQNIWLTFGQYRELIGGAIGFNQPIPQHVIQKNLFRQWPNIPSHLRTFRAWLFKRIKKEDLMLDGQFFMMCADMAAMIPMIEMAGERHKFIDKVLYIYNNNNPLSDHNISKSYQRKLDLYIRSKKSYKRLKSK